MKYLLLLLLFITSCSKKTTINLNNTNSIQYNDVFLIKENFDNVTKVLENLEFNCYKNKTIDGDLLKIVTDKQIYNIYIYDDTIEFKNNNEYCLYKDISIKNFSNNLNELYNTYNNSSFYNIFQSNNYIENNNDEIIKLDKSDKYLIINTSNKLYDFSINEIEWENNVYEEINRLYYKDIIESNVVIRKENITNIKISFTNKYNYNISIIPYKDNEIIKFKQEIYQKKENH